MSLLALPTETLWAIASYLRRQRDIFALIQTNRHLYNTLIDCLYSFRGQHKHGIALSFVAERGLTVQLRKLLHGLEVSRNWRKNSKDDEDEGDEEETPITRSTYGPRWSTKDAWCQDIFAHPLYRQGYDVLSVVNIQHALVVAIQSGHTEIVIILLDFGAQVNFYCGSRTQIPTMYNETTMYWHEKEVDYPPLFTAVQFGNLELVKLLLQRGADPELYAPSPLYRAVEDGRRDIIPILLEHGVGPQATALKLAVLHGDESMVRFLLDRGFNVSRYGYAALYSAEKKKNWDIFNLLKSYGATLAELSVCDRITWEGEDGDGTCRPFIQNGCPLYDPGVVETEDEREAAPEAAPEAGLVEV